MLRIRHPVYRLFPTLSCFRSFLSVVSTSLSLLSLFSFVCYTLFLFELLCVWRVASVCECVGVGVEFDSISPTNNNTTNNNTQHNTINNITTRERTIIYSTHKWAWRLQKSAREKKLRGLQVERKPPTQFDRKDTHRTYLYSYTALRRTSSTSSCQFQATICQAISLRRLAV